MSAILFEAAAAALAAELAKEPDTLADLKARIAESPDWIRGRAQVPCRDCLGTGVPQFREDCRGYWCTDITTAIEFARGIPAAEVVYSYSTEFGLAETGYKVCILASVSAWSTTEWSAFGKVAADPPQNVVFLLVTNEPTAIPLTIRGVFGFIDTECSVCQGTKVLPEFPLHFTWGMQIRNWLRSNGFTEATMGIDNWDDHYIGVVERAVVLCS